MKTFFFKISLLVFISLFLIFSIDSFIVENKLEFEKYKRFYSKDKNTIDLLIIGNSHAHCGLNSKIISSKCNLNAYNLSLSGTNFFDMYYSLEEALRFQSPKIVVIENFALLSSGQPQEPINEDGFRYLHNPYSFYAKKGSLSKIKESQELFLPQNRLYKSFNIFRNHEFWTNLEETSSVLYKYTSKVKESSYYDNGMGKSILNKKRAIKIQKTKFEDKAIISDEEKKYIKKIIELSKKHNFELMFVTVPFYRAYYNATISNYNQAYMELIDICKKESNVSLVDLNEFNDYDRTCIIDERGNNLKNQHLNYKGQIIASNDLANIINKRHENIFKNNELTYESPERILYNLKKFKSDPYMVGNVNKVNNSFYQGIKGEKVIVIPKSSNVISIEGWMFKKNLDKKNFHKLIALKKNDNFIFVTINDWVKNKEVPLIEKKYGNEYQNSGYKLTLPKELFDKGKYSIYHIILDQNGKYYLGNPYKKIFIE